MFKNPQLEVHQNLAMEPEHPASISHRCLPHLRFGEKYRAGTDGGEGSGTAQVAGHEGGVGEVATGFQNASGGAADMEVFCSVSSEQCRFLENVMCFANIMETGKGRVLVKSRTFAACPQLEQKHPSKRKALKMAVMLVRPVWGPSQGRRKSGTGMDLQLARKKSVPAVELQLVKAGQDFPQSHDVPWSAPAFTRDEKLIVRIWLRRRSQAGLRLD